jgi:hypothetical protein
VVARHQLSKAERQKGNECQPLAAKLRACRNGGSASVATHGRQMGNGGRVGGPVGGRSRSATKVAAAKANGKKGGRPKSAPQLPGGPCKYCGHRQSDRWPLGVKGKICHSCWRWGKQG